VITRIDRMTPLLLNDATAEAVVWLSLSLCFKAIRVETITRETRIFVLRICFFLVRNLYKAEKSGRDTNPEAYKKKKTTMSNGQ
jgi:hypothetical protein